MIKNISNYKYSLILINVYVLCVYYCYNPNEIRLKAHKPVLLFLLPLHFKCYKKMLKSKRNLHICVTVIGVSIAKVG